MSASSTRTQAPDLDAMHRTADFLYSNAQDLRNRAHALRAIDRVAALALENVAHAMRRQANHLRSQAKRYQHDANNKRRPAPRLSEASSS